MATNKHGFSLVELLIAMTLFVIIIASASSVFISMLTAYKQQAKISETNIEGIIGLDIMRRDIEHAGIGLAWDLDGTTYCEAVNDTDTLQDERDYNDTNATCTVSAAPRALVSGDGDGDGVAGGAGSDVIAVKSVIAALNEASQKWTHVNMANISQEWNPATERLQTGDKVIVMVPGDNRKLVRTSTGGFFTTYNNNSGSVIDDRLANTFFLPSAVDRHNIVYGINTAADPALRMPFNRADFYVRTPLITEPFPMPERCAAGTGVLYKGTVNHQDPILFGQLTEMPLLDCVADMQIGYGYDNDNNDTTPIIFTNDFCSAGSTTPLPVSENVRTIKQVRVYVLAHEGQRDTNYTFTPATGTNICATCIRLGTPADLDQAVVLGRNFDLTAVTDWENYRWKLYTLVVDISG